MKTFISFVIEDFSNENLLLVLGNLNENLVFIEKYLQVKILNRANNFKIEGDKENCNLAMNFILNLYEETNKFKKEFTNEDIQLRLQAISSNNKNIKVLNNKFCIKIKSQLIKPKTINQEKYIKSIENNIITFGVGPAGTGKTFLAIACAVKFLEIGKVKKIILIRPAVEAGENLGFLPGDLTQKINPYLKPMYDALNQLLGFENTAKLIEKQIIEIAPLAFMRGRTLSNAFIILDEAQNSTKEQMKMLLTRIGFNSTAVITGDITQIDLPQKDQSGLIEATKILNNISGIKIMNFENIDIIRHPLIQKIVNAYDKVKKQN